MIVAYDDWDLIDLEIALRETISYNAKQLVEKTDDLDDYNVSEKIGEYRDLLLIANTETSF